ncbi:MULTISPECIES: IclR family transcriptional regulator [unclassified Microbacterium]|uniref:IclR family transcriptional regulator n=1 Tax=unclassified Microbacterium TaxID=2609290 RepID=UPI0008F54FAF|nr:MULTISPECIES: IclR family transcriptional regulator [unclassified Microbacterium]OIJ32434.1 IclR family transcriptional regulator [Microbacterium sp. LCT-H2]
MTDTDQAVGAVKSAGRALEIIEHLAATGSQTFPELLDDLGLPRSSAHGLLRTLQAAGWVDHDATSKRYSLGLKAWQIGQRYDGHRLLLESGPALMAALTEEIGETVQMARLDGVENVYIAISPSPNPMRLASNVGMRLHAHATGIGKALLSTLDDADISRRLRQVAMPRLTSRTITDPDEILTVIAKGRDIGFHVDDEEFIDGCRCVAMPITWPEETGVAAALSVTMPTSRTDERWPHSVVEPLRRTVLRLRRAMSLPGTGPALP